MLHRLSQQKYRNIRFKGHKNQETYKSYLTTYLIYNRIARIRRKKNHNLTLVQLNKQVGNK